MPIVRWILPTQRLSGLPSEKVFAKYSPWTRETSQSTGFTVGSVPQSSLDPRTLITNRLSPALRMVEQGPITDGISDGLRCLCYCYVEGFVLPEGASRHTALPHDIQSRLDASSQPSWLLGFRWIR